MTIAPVTVIIHDPKEDKIPEIKCETAMVQFVY